MTNLRLIVNGAEQVAEADPLEPLGQVLRETLGLGSVRLACDVGACGSCTVLLDDQPVRSCLVPVGLVGDRAVVTNEGIADDDPVRAAFVAAGAFQCGFCIPGMVLATKALLAQDPHADEAAASHALIGNLCRCGTYPAIRDALEALRHA